MEKQVVTNTPPTGYSDSVRKISALPQWVRERLYELRTRYDWHVPKDDYLERFKLVVVGRDVYCADDEVSRGLLDEYFRLEESESPTVASVPHAVIRGGMVLKNRFGWTEGVRSVFPQATTTRQPVRIEVRDIRMRQLSEETSKSK